ncbi:hypothetical protein H0H92_009549, partial [Tricholoma furcatifolium]
MPSTFTPSDSVYDGFPLPLELLREITRHLESTEQRNNWILEVGIDQENLLILKANDGSNIFFQFIRSFPNLKALNYYQSFGLLPPREFFDSIRDAPLSELTLKFSSYFIVESPPTEGLASLKRLSISWTGTDSPSTPGGSLDHLYHLIRPSLATLVALRIDNSPETGKDLDLRLLRRAGETLRVFDYSMRNFDEGVLDLIPEIFPHLTNLVLEWGLFWDEERDAVYSLPWKVTCFLDSHIASLSRNKNLLHLQLSFDLEYGFNDFFSSDFDYSWYIRCYKRRLDATNKLAGVMPLLRTCRWLHLGTGR